MMWTEQFLAPEREIG